MRRLESRQQKRKTEEDKEDKGRTRKRVNGVLFLPFKHHSKLATDLRDTEMKFEEITEFRLKMGEKSRTKVGHVLTDSDPWSGQDCPTERCWLCETKSITGKNKRQECTKRNLVYETYCMSCESKEKTETVEGQGEE